MLNDLKSGLERDLNNISGISEQKREDMCSNYELICKIDPKTAQNIYETFDYVFEENSNLKSIQQKYSEKLSAYITAFKIDSSYKDLKQTIGGKKLYLKKSDHIDGGVNSKNLWVLGETGSGKTTWLNSVINYLLGIKYTDQIRLKMIVEQGMSQAHSQTVTVNSYEIKPNPKIFSYPIRFIDTPGFGDTRGIEQDETNAKLIKNFIVNSCDELHGILFVLKASTNRLTIIQKYIIQQVLGIFGKDASQNFIAMFTFADNQKPQALSAIEEGGIPIVQHFKFNNSAIFPKDEPDSDETLSKIFWDMGYKSFRMFFDSLQQITPLSLKLTKQVINERDNIKLKVGNLHEKIKDWIIKRQNLDEIKVEINKISSENELNKNFTI
ncbi:MAG: GTPase, partial [Mycoplasma sp.]